MNKEINNILLSIFGIEVFKLKDGQMQTDEPPFYGTQYIKGTWVEIDYNYWSSEDLKKWVFNKKIKKLIPLAIYCDDDVFCFIPN